MNKPPRYHAPADWERTTFHVALAAGIALVHGHTSKGLGLVRVEEGAWGLKVKPLWSLVHLGSGHQIVEIEAWTKEAFSVASSLVDCGDWTFDALNGYRNTDPDLLSRTLTLARMLGAHRPDKGRRNHEMAREIATARA